MFGIIKYLRNFYFTLAITVNVDYSGCKNPSL